MSPNRVIGDMLTTQNAILRISCLDLFSNDRTLRGHRDPAANPIRSQALANNVTRSVEAGIVNNAWTWSRTELATRTFAMQNFLLKDRLVTTFGWRKDELKVFSETTVRDGNTVATGFVRSAGQDPVVPGDTRSLQSEGYEFELTANPTRRIRFSLSAKKAETKVDRLLGNVAYAVSLPLPRRVRVTFSLGS